MKMQQSQQYTTDIDTQNLDTRYSSLDIPAHGNVPKWLEDMSNTVKRSNSEMDSKSASEMNNNKSTPKIAEEYFDYLLKSPVSQEISSAKHGRRANKPTGTPKTKISKDLNEYIVPNINNLKLSEISNTELGTKFNKKEDRNQSTHKKPPEDLERYTPSLLAKENGRHSRLDLDDNKFYSELISAINDSYKPKSIPKHISLRENDSEKLMPPSNILKDNKKSKKIIIDYKDYENIQKLNSSGNLFNKIPLTSENTLFVFDQSYKNKLQKYNRKLSTPTKKTRYKKFKYKQNLSKKEGKQVELNKFVKKEPTGKKVDNIDDVFIIPELPTGSKMCINILTTWGDKYYVGLNGIEIFCSDGTPIEIKKITAADINVLPDCVNDPRVASNLFDGVNCTHDDCHLWLAPFDSGKNHYIYIDFAKHSEIAMMRIWNYNKSRIHSSRGARYIEITLDSVSIFKGEIAQACGSVNGNIDSLGDTILYTTEEIILEKISKNDEAFQNLVLNSNLNATEKIDDRPITATAENNSERPLTFAKNYNEDKNKFIGTQKIDIVLMSNWGRSDFIGLTGIELIGHTEEDIKISEKNISCNFLGNLSALIDDENLTNDPKNMWSVSYNASKHVIITIQLENYTYVSGLRFWNYNESIEKTFGGVRELKIFLDNKLYPNNLAKNFTFMLRRAPGNTNYDFVQEISFIDSNDVKTTESVYDFNDISGLHEETFEQPNMPQGFIIQIVIYTTWGDQYYVGLNGIELYDHLGRMILLSENNICAYPESVNVLPGISGDVRTPEKLIDNINDTKDGTHSWLAPVIPKCLNRIYIVFDQPVTISVFKFWNYTKTASRGVREFGILFDDLLVYNGILDKANETSAINYQSILFTNNSDVIKKEMATLVKHSIDSQGTVLTNDKLRMTTGGSLPNVDQSLRPFTSVNQKRDRTSLSN